MTTDHPSLLGVSDLEAEQAAAAASLERELDAVHRWSWGTVAPDGSTLEDHLREIRMHAITLRTVQGLLRAAAD